MNNLELLQLASQWGTQEHQVVIGTVINTWGSSPRPVGSVIIINELGEFEGSVSGGCIEGAVIHEALEIMKTQKEKLIEFGVSDDTAWSVGLTCGGQIEIYLEPFDKLNKLLAPWFDKINTSGLLLLRPLNGALPEIIIDADVELLNTPMLGLPDGTVKEAFKKNQAKLVNLDSGSIFLQPLITDHHIIIVGAVHIAQHLIPMLINLNFKVTLIDPRTAFANRARFPDIDVVHEWPQDILPNITINHQVGLVTLTHDPKIDNPAILNFLTTNAFYIGCLGSKKTHAKRTSFLKDEGFTEVDIEKISAPIGLDLGGRAPSEIALSIASEIISRKYQV
jgi:xanthine dehydrogenase accessory factor